MGLRSHLFLGTCLWGLDITCSQECVLCLGTCSWPILPHSPFLFRISPSRPTIKSPQPSSPKQFPLPRKSSSAPSLSSEELRFRLLVPARMSCLQCDTLISHTRVRPPGKGPMEEQQQKDTDLQSTQLHLPFPQIMWERGPQLWPGWNFHGDSFLTTTFDGKWSPQDLKKKIICRQTHTGWQRLVLIFSNLISNWL